MFQPTERNTECSGAFWKGPDLLELCRPPPSLAFVWQRPPMSTGGIPLHRPQLGGARGAGALAGGPARAHLREGMA
eukprot:1457502-Alexandrium_andersonii.AAC.1